MNVGDLIDLLRKYPPTTEVVIDDPVNGCLLAPVLRETRNPDGDSSVVLCTPSDVGDLSAGDAITTGLIEESMRSSGEPFEEDDDHN